MPAGTSSCRQEGGSHIEGTIANLEKDVATLLEQVEYLQKASLEASQESNEDRDDLATLKGVTLMRPVILFPGRQGTEVYPLSVADVRGLQLGQEAEAASDL